MAITFLGYLDEPEEMTSPKRRRLLGCDSSSDTSDLPTNDSFDGHGVPAPWSIALVRGGDTQILGTDGTWASL